MDLKDQLKKKKNWVIALFIFLSASIATYKMAFEKNFLVALPPIMFMGPSGAELMSFYEIVLKDAGLRPKFVSLGRKEALLEIDDDKIDAMIGLVPSEKFNTDNLAFTKIPILRGVLHIYTIFPHLKINKSNFQKYRGVLNETSYYFEQEKVLLPLDVKTVPTAKEMFSVLVSRQADFTFGPPFVFAESSHPAFKMLIFDKEPILNVDYHFVVSKEHESKLARIEESFKRNRPQLERFKLVKAAFIIPE